MAKNSGNQANDTKQLKFQGPILNIPLDGTSPDIKLRQRIETILGGPLEDSGVDLSVYKYVQWQLKNAPAKIAGNVQPVSGATETYFDVAAPGDDIWEASNFLTSCWDKSTAADALLVFQFLSK